MTSLNIKTGNRQLALEAFYILSVLVEASKFIFIFNSDCFGLMYTNLG